jgi:hypothetical protein
MAICSMDCQLDEGGTILFKRNPLLASLRNYPRNDVEAHKPVRTEVSKGERGHF